jgi:hypothetical protein
MESNRYCQNLSSVLEKSKIEDYLCRDIIDKFDVKPYVIFEGEELNGGKPALANQLINVKKGLILYHMTSTLPNQKWYIPQCGTFFSYNVVHPLVIMGDFGLVDKISEEGHVGQLKRFVLINDVTLRVIHGDLHPCQKMGTMVYKEVNGWYESHLVKPTDCNYNKDDGSIVAGYEPNYEVPIQEITLCNGNNVQFIDEILITKDFVDEIKLLRANLHLNVVGSNRKLIPLPPICPTADLYEHYRSHDLNLWHADNVSTLMYLFAYLKDKVSYIYRFLLFDKAAAIYVISDINDPYHIVGVVMTTFTNNKPRRHQLTDGFLKIWSSADYKYKTTVWPLVESFLSYETIFRFSRNIDYTFVMIDEDLRNLDNEKLDYGKYIENKLQVSTNKNNVKSWRNKD